jgi:ribosomal protein L12E/L44/L45/RPP1/RPP2
LTVLRVKLELTTGGGIQVRGSPSDTAIPELKAVKIAEIIHENSSHAPTSPASSAQD